jgi:hypothetical protein
MHRAPVTTFFRCLPHSILSGHAERMPFRNAVFKNAFLFFVATRALYRSWFVQVAVSACCKLLSSVLVA